jgi:hypothetical protein
MTIILSGGIGRSGLGGQAWAYLQYLIGFRELGHDVYYLEDCGETSNVWNWDTEEWTQELDFPASYVRDCLEPFGFKDHWIYRTTAQSAGMSLEKIKAVCSRADLLIMRAIPLWDWRPEYDRPNRRIFIDVDPGFTQAQIAGGEEGLAAAIRRADHLFTIGQRIGEPDCSIPTLDWTWHPLVPPVALSEWPFAESNSDTHFTSIMRWRGFGNVTLGGVTYGEKDVEFTQFMDLPRLTGQQFRIAINGPDFLAQHGWEIVPGEIATRTPAAYRQFIQESRGEFGVARQYYVQTRGGWFSDRSVCYLASGRPVLLQDTGLKDWLPVDEGVVWFRDLAEAIGGLSKINGNYSQQRQAARQIAEDRFSTKKVLPHLLETAMR